MPVKGRPEGRPLPKVIGAGPLSPPPVCSISIAAAGQWRLKGRPKGRPLPTDKGRRCPWKADL